MTKHDLNKEQLINMITDCSKHDLQCYFDKYTKRELLDLLEEQFEVDMSDDSLSED